MTNLEKVQTVLTDARMQRRAGYIQGFQYGARGEVYVIRDVLLDWQFQELFRTEDRALYEKRLEMEKSKFAARAILAALGMKE